MLLSVYSTDAAQVRDAVVAQARTQEERCLFTSLHMPEARDLAAWVAWMGEVHRAKEVTFWADISPRSLDILGLTVERMGELREAGVVGLRIDDGYGVEGIARIARATGLPVALNASTVSAAELDAALGVLGEGTDGGPEVVGWHNFYPRPGTGLAEDFFVSQSRLFAERGLRLLAFVAGDVSHRAPLYLGLPTLEAHRHRDTYTSALALRALVPGVEVVCAEGTVAPHHLQWIADADGGRRAGGGGRGVSGQVGCDGGRRAGHTGRRHGGGGPVLTLPLVDLQPGCDWLLGEWELRVEQTGTSQRLLGTRGHDLPAGTVNAATREAGSLQMETLGRYSGEVHLMTRTLSLDGEHLRLADIAAPYRDLAALARGGETIRLVRA